MIESEYVQATKNETSGNRQTIYILSKQGMHALSGWLVLLASIALHLPIIFFWQTASSDREMPAAKTPALLVQLMTLQAHERLQPEPLAPKPETMNPTQLRKRSTTPPATSSEAIPTTPTPLATSPADEKKDLPIANTLAESTIFNAKRDIGKIDRDLRKDFPKLPQAAPNSMQSRLEKGIAAAAKPGATKMEDMISTDGRRMTKVTGPEGTYCVRKEGAGATDGLDMMQGGVRSKTTNCPENFSF